MPLPGVHDEPSLTTIGRAFGVIDPEPEARSIPSRTTGGGSRLAVLAQDITDELLAQPEEDPEETPPGFDP
jgi:hypothetical protein